MFRVQGFHTGYHIWAIYHEMSKGAAKLKGKQIKFMYEFILRASKNYNSKTKLINRGAGTSQVLLWSKDVARLKLQIKQLICSPDLKNL